MLATTTTTTTIKLASYPIIAFLFAYTGLSMESMSILTILFALDTMTGVLRQYVVEPAKLSSRIGIIGVLSKCLTLFIPVIISLVAKGSNIDMNAFMQLSINILIVYEGWSIVSNIGQIRAKDETLNEYDAISFLIKKTQDLLKLILSGLLKNDK